MSLILACSYSIAIPSATILLEAKLRDAQLNEQFKYFRIEFMEAASASGVTVPLDLLEDNSGRLFSFMQTQTGQSGPKYVLSVMESNPESVHLMRCSLSLLIVTIHVCFITHCNWYFVF